MSAQDIARTRWLRSPFGEILRLSFGQTLAGLVLTTLLITLFALALPIALLHVYDRILPNAALGTLSMLAIGVAVALMIETALRIIRGDVLGRIAARAEAELHQAAMTRLLDAPSRLFPVRGAGYYSERLFAIGSLREAWSGPALQSLLDIPFAFVYLAILWGLAGPLVLVPLGLLGAALLLAVATGARIRRRAESLAQVEERRLNFLYDVLQGLHTVKLLGASALMERRYERLQGTAAQSRRRLTDATGAAQDAGLMLAQLSTLGVAAWGAMMALDGRLSIGGLGAAVMLAGRSMQPLVGGITLWSRLQAVADRLARVAELDALPAESRPGLPPLRVGAGHLVIEGVTYGPQIDDRHLFEGLELEVAPGEHVGIVGRNGSGRSSLLQLIAGEVAPAAGRVLIDGQDLAQHDIGPARPAISLVPQGPAVVQGSLLVNLTLHAPGVEEAAMRAGALMGLDDFASTLPQGWHTRIGPGGVYLPRGMVQRLGIARALALSPRLLLLDDVTADLDPEGDACLVRALATLHGTTGVVMVSHRASVLNRMDRVMALGDGRLTVRS